MRKTVLYILIAVAIMACTTNVPPAVNLTKDHSIEVSYETRQLNDSAVLLIRHENVYLHGEKIKTFFRTDTLPSPGDSIAQEEEETEDSSTKAKIVPIEYEFYVTVK
jgi:hypothetical protein